MAGDKICLVDEVRCHNLVLTETQMAGSNGTGFFGVVHKVALCTVVGFSTNDLNGILAKGVYWWKVAFGDLTGWVYEDGLVSSEAP